MADRLTNPLDPNQQVRAVLFDLDGTLYSQPRLRALMAIELCTLPLSGPSRTWPRFRALSAYRRAQEQLRSMGRDGSISAAQIEAASDESGLRPDEVARLVDEWMLRRPLKYLRWCRAPGIARLLDGLDTRGVRAGVLSDYPADAKILALGLAGRFSPVLCSTDPGIGALKPNPRGFLRACEVWRLDPREVLVVGDRADVDAAGAAAAGMPCVIIGRGGDPDSTNAGYRMVSSIERLCRVLDADSW